MLKLERSYSFQGDMIAWDTIGQGEPIVLIHGTPFSSFVWRNIARELALTRQVFFYDLLGYGQSTKREDQDVSLGIQNVVLSNLLSYWGLTKPDIIAHDFGGTTALRALLINGCSYRRMLLFDVVALRPWGSPLVQHVRNHEIAFSGTPEYLHRAILRAYIQTASSRQMTDQELEPYIRPWLGVEGQPAFYRQIARMDLKYTDEIEDRFGEIDCPVQLLWGGSDQWIPPERGRELAKRIPGCSYREVPGSGHLMQEDAPEAIISAALNFLK